MTINNCIVSIKRKECDTMQCKKQKRQDIKCERDKMVCSLYKKNVLISKIAKDLSIDRHTVTRILKKHNLYNYDKSRIHLSQEKLDRNIIMRQYFLKEKKQNLK